MKKSEKAPFVENAVETVGAVVARDYRAAAVLEKHGLDFCCGGNVPLEKACREKGIDPDGLRREIAEATSKPLDRSQNYDAWEPPFLADFIVNTHHVYLRENLPTIAAYTRKIAQVHGAAHPEVVEIAAIFEKVAAEMDLHLQKEEEVLFPAVRRLFELRKKGGPAEEKEAAELASVLSELGDEHDAVGAAVHEIRRLASDYTVPEGVCNTFTVTYEKLREFEDDLHRHVHLENNILFPKTAQLRGTRQEKV